MYDALMMYERVENIEIDKFMKKTPKRRDWYLLHTPPNELVCYFHFMSIRDFLACFSKEAIRHCFRKLPPDDLIHLCKYVPASYIPLFLPSCRFSIKWQEMNPDVLVYESYADPDIILNLVNEKCMTYNDLYPAFKELSMCKLSRLYSRHPLFSTLFSPLLEEMYVILHYLPPELVECILSFLFVKPKKIGKN